MSEKMRRNQDVQILLLAQSQKPLRKILLAHVEAHGKGVIWHGCVGAQRVPKEVILLQDQHFRKCPKPFL